MQHGNKTYIVASISRVTLDALAAFEVELVDLEPDHDDGDGSAYDDPDFEIEHDNEPENESVSLPEFDPDAPVGWRVRIPGTLG